MNALNVARNTTGSSLISVALYHGAKANTPTRVDEMLWSELVACLTEAVEDENAEKTNLLAWSPVSFRGIQRRADKNIAAVHALVLDVDATASAAEVKDALERASLAAMIYTSPSDPGDGTRFRVVAPTTRPMTAEECGRARVAFADAIGLDPACGVAKTLDPSRIFFVGRVTSTEPRSYWVGEGAPVDVDALLSAPLSGNWAAPAKTSTASSALDFDAERMARAEIVIENMPPSVSGHEGDEAHFQAACEAAKILGPNADAIEDVLLRKFNPRCVPPWGDLRVRREAERAAERRAKFERTTKAPLERVHAANDSSGSDDPNPPYVVNDGRVWLRDGRGGFRSPVKMRDLIPAIRAAGLYEIIGKDAENKRRRAEAIYDDGDLVTDFAKDFAEPRTLCRKEGDRLILIEGHECPVFEPSEDPAVGAWLACLFGDGVSAAEEWIASCAQRYIRQPAACFVHVGPDSIGKTVLHLALARMWGASEPVPLGGALAQFNGSIRRCPNVLDDEARELAKREVSTRDLRTLIAQDYRDVELKGKEKSGLHGCLRYAITANDVTQLTFRDLDGAATLAAIKVRLAVHVTPDERKAEAEDLLVRLRVTPNIDRIDLDRVARHFSWIQTTRDVRPSRFLGTHGSAADGAVLAGHAVEHARVFDYLRGVLESEAGVPHDDASPFIQARDGRLLVSTGDLARKLGGTYSDADLGRVQKALEPIRKRGSGRPKYKAVAIKRSFWELDPDALAEACGTEA
jgi:hypothetical protein